MSKTAGVASASKPPPKPAPAPAKSASSTPKRSTATAKSTAAKPAAAKPATAKPAAAKPAAAKPAAAQPAAAKPAAAKPSPSAPSAATPSPAKPAPASAGPVAPAPSKEAPKLPPEVVNVNRGTGEKSAGPVPPPPPPPDPAQLAREAEDKALAKLPSHAQIQAEADLDQRAKDSQRLDEWKRQKAERERLNPRLNMQSCIEGDYVRRQRELANQPPLSLSALGPRGLPPAGVNAEIDRRFDAAATSMTPLDRANLADRYANKLSPPGAAQEDDRMRRFMGGSNPEDARRASEAFRVREADRLRAAAGAGGVTDADRAAMRKRADELVARPITAEERASITALQGADARTISKNDAADGLAMLDRIRPADHEQYAKGTNIKKGTEHLFLSDSQINHMFNADIWREDRSLERKVPANLLRGGVNCADCHPDKKDDFRLDLRGFEPGAFGGRGGAAGNRDVLESWLNGKGGPPLGGKGGTPADPPAPKLDTDPTGTAIERYMARDQRWGTLTPEKRADKAFMERFEAEKTRLRAEDQQRRDIFANPADPTKRLKTPYNQLSPDDRRIVDQHRQLFETRSLEQKLGPQHQRLAEEYRKNGWGEDSRSFGVDHASFMRDLAEKDPAKISRYDAFRGLRTADEYRKQNPDVFAQNPANFAASREKATSLYYRNLDEMRAAKVEDLAAREAAIAADPNNPIGYLKQGLGALSPEQNEIVMRDYSRYSIERLEQKLRGQTVAGIGEQVTSLDRHFARMVDDQGVVGSGANWLKNHIGTDGGWIVDSNLGSNAVQNTIQGAYVARDQVLDLRNFKGTHEEFLAAYDARLKNLEGQLGGVRTHMQKFQGSQNNWVDGIADVTSTMAAVGGAALAPVTGGASLAVGIAVGASVKVGVKGLDALTGSGNYEGNIFLDGATGGLNGLTGAGSMMATKKASEVLLKRAAVGLAEGETIPWLTRAGIFMGTRVPIGAADGFVSGTGTALLKGDEDPLGRGLRGAAVGAVMFPLGEGATKGLGKLWKASVRPAGLPDHIATDWKGRPIDAEGKLLNLQKNWKGQWIIPDDLKPAAQTAGARAAGDPVAAPAGRGAPAGPTAAPPGRAAPAGAAHPVPGRVGAVTNEEVIKGINGQLKVLDAGDVDGIVQRFPAELQDQARRVLARSSGFGNLESLNELRKAMEPHLAAGGRLYTPGSGSLGDNLGYLAGKGNFKGLTPTSGSSLQTTGAIEPKAVVLLDDVVLNRIRTDPAFAKSLIDHNAVLMSPRGFNDGLNMFNTPTVDAIASRTQSLLDRATRIQQGGGAKTFDDAVTQALDHNTMSTLRAANPALPGRVQTVDAVGAGNPSNAVTAARLSGTAGMTQADLDGVLNKLPARYHDAARQLLAEQAQVFSPRRISQDLTAQHQRIMDQATAQGIRPEDVYFYIPQGNKSYGTMALAHRQATGTPVDRYINGVQDLQRRGLGPKTALAVLDDVAGTGDSLYGATAAIEAQRYAGKVMIAPMVSTTEAQALLGGAHAKHSYLPGRVIEPLAESTFYKSLDPRSRDMVRMMLGDWGYGNNGLSVSFPYMAPDNNNHFFGDLVAPFFILNRNAAASKSKGYVPPN